MENFPKKSECREDDLQDYKITRPKLTYFISALQRKKKQLNIHAKTIT
jgi:hypothetical protein